MNMAHHVVMNQSTCTKLAGSDQMTRRNWTSSRSVSHSTWQRTKVVGMSFLPSHHICCRWHRKAFLKSSSSLLQSSNISICLHLILNGNFLKFGLDEPA